jgi:albonoursin synthase
MSRPQELQAGDVLLEEMSRRRVTRQFLDQPVPAAAITQILRAAYWAPRAGNRRIHHFLVIRDAGTIAGLRPFAPGILGLPAALVVISTDLDLAREQNVQISRDRNGWIDVGTEMLSMMLAAQALGLGSCPATSFSQAAVAKVLMFPPSLRPELILQIGYPATEPVRRGKGPADPVSPPYTDWERIGHSGPAAEHRGHA